MAALRAIDVPQADRLEKVFAVAKCAALGSCDLASIAAATQLSARHALYYAHAARILGWVTIESNRLLPTLFGREIVTARSSAETVRLLGRAIASMRAASLVVPFFLGESTPRSLAEALATKASLSLATAKRRTTTLASWREYFHGAGGHRDMLTVGDTPGAPERAMTKVPSGPKTDLAGMVSERRSSDARGKAKLDSSLPPASVSGIVFGPFPRTAFQRIELDALPKRARSFCEQEGVAYVGDLLRFSRSELLARQNLGRKSVSCLESVARRVGLALGSALPGWEFLDHEAASRWIVPNTEGDRTQGDAPEVPVAKTVEEEIASCLSRVLPSRRLSIVLARIGWARSDEPTLENVGNEFEISRERVRQVVQGATDAARKRPPKTPRLEEAVALLTAMEGMSADRATEALVEAGLIRQGTTARAVLSAASVFYATVAVSIERTTFGEVLTSERNADLPELVRRIAKRATQRWGCSTLDDIASAASEQSGAPISTDVVARILELVPDFSWLDRDGGGWFWIRGESRNRLVNNLNKALSVAHSVDISELRAAVRRHHRMGQFAPPRRVLAALCSQLDDCAVDSNIVRDVGDREPGEELSDAEQSLFLILQEHGPLLALRELERHAEALGMNPTTVSMTIFNSPAIRRYAPGVYGLLGANVSPGAVREAQPGRRSTHRTVLKDSGWNDDGSAWVLYELSSASIRSGVLSLPSELRRFLSGEYVVDGPEGGELARLRSRESQIWGFLRVLARLEPEPGDLLHVRFDIEGHKASVTIIEDAPAGVPGQAPMSEAASPS